MIPRLAPARRIEATLALLAAVAFAGCTPASAPTAPPPPSDQGVGPNEEEAAALAVRALLAEPRVAMVVLPRRIPGGDFRYEVVADLDRDGSPTRFTFVRQGQPDGSWQFVRSPLEGDLDPGQDPLARTEPTALATREEELAAAAGGKYIPLASSSFPHAFERLAATFDHPDAPDLAVIHAPSGKGGGGGQHGDLDVTQSRSPLVIAGPGVMKAPGGLYGGAARLVDIAPTLARLLGIRGVRGRRLDGSIGDTLLARQDGRVLEEILVKDARADRAIVLVSDGLSHTLVRRMLAAGRIPNLGALLSKGGIFEAGAIGNFPSSTFPGHNVVGTGAYSGHHGLLSNGYYDRKTRAHLHPYGDKFGTGRYLFPEVETLFEALARSHGAASIRTLSINDPCGRGATLSTLEPRFPSGVPAFNPLEVALPTIAGLAGTEEVAAYVGDMLSVSLIEEQFLEARRGLHPAPIFTLVNLGLTDMLGHRFGPHDPMSEQALARVDALVGELVAFLRREGFLDGTLFVLTADHGMEDQDPAFPGRSASGALAAAGVKTAEAGSFVYLSCLEVEIVRSGKGATERLDVLVRDDDFDATNRRPPVAGAKVSVRAAGVELASSLTDDAGRAALDVSPPAGVRDLEVVVTHPDFNSRRKISP